MALSTELSGTMVFSALLADWQSGLSNPDLVVRGVWPDEEEEELGWLEGVVWVWFGVVCVCMEVALVVVVVVGFGGRESGVEVGKPIINNIYIYINKLN